MIPTTGLQTPQQPSPTKCENLVEWYRKTYEEQVSKMTTDAATSGNIQATLDQRANSHGSFIDNGIIMQALKSRVRNVPGWEKLAPYQAEAIDMILHKIGRILSGNPDFTDHWHDIAGYATLVEKELTSSPLNSVQKKGFQLPKAPLQLNENLQHLANPHDPRN